MVTTNALPGRTHWQGGNQPGRQAHKLEEAIRVHSTKQDEKKLYFVVTTREVAETVIFRQYVPGDIIPSIRECNSSNTARTPKNISDVCTAAAVDTACARGSVLLMTYYWYTRMSTYKGIVCLSKRTYRYSHKARMNVSSVEQYHTTSCRPG